MYTVSGVDLAHITLYFIERQAVVVKTVVSFSGDRGLESRRSGWISLGRPVVIFPPAPPGNAGVVLYSRPQLLFLRQFQFMIQCFRTMYCITTAIETGAIVSVFLNTFCITHRLLIF
jgi:hypothetical protein